MTKLWCVGKGLGRTQKQSFLAHRKFLPILKLRPTYSLFFDHEDSWNVCLSQSDMSWTTTTLKMSGHNSQNYAAIVIFVDNCRRYLNKPKLLLQRPWYSKNTTRSLNQLLIVESLWMVTFLHKSPWTNPVHQIKDNYKKNVVYYSGSSEI